jgi:hypothetical protein
VRDLKFEGANGAFIYKEAKGNSESMEHGFYGSNGFSLINNKEDQ